MGWWIAGSIGGLVVLIALYDIAQKKRAILRNFPIIGHFRYIFESVGPELRQYIVTSNDEERPFSRDQRRWVYASAKRENNYFGFGTDNELERTSNYLIIKHAAFPVHPAHDGDAGGYAVPCAKVLGAARGRAKAFRPRSIVNVSGMSYGSLSAAAIEALSRGCALAGCLHNTGEGGIAPHHLYGGDLVWQIGTGYFGCRDGDSRFDKAKFLEAIDEHPVRAIEIKLSQGAKPGLGGVLPAAKVTREISRIRGIEVGRDCLSPATHSAFGSVDEMLDFVEELGQDSGLPIGIKSAVGQPEFWQDLAALMSRGDRGVDFVTVDGSEGGTGAGPLVFTDHVALPFKLGMARVYSEFARAGVAEDVVFVGSGKLGFPENAVLAMALGCDLLNVGRGAMFAIGCIQAQRCHSGHCPTGVATQNRWLMRGLDPRSKAARLANYFTVLRKELLRIANACGVEHPALITLDELEILDDQFGTRSAREAFAYDPTWRTWPQPIRDELRQLMRSSAYRA